ncbi:tetratricopeptide repeat protein [Candidatus Finniella inopinata]|uniref:Sel1 repeat family protein n=1 Tax=Candidatus Finniella inopinata TaxID=1696036 RepID=A0A4V2DZT2_9PROT|nr:tetratricopeptide repeat protein [Candidatus Finniella inopinata]RZI46147.1 sel1 repeat family protein [Candidatus Finniella inopinata]
MASSSSFTEMESYSSHSQSSQVHVNETRTEFEQSLYTISLYPFLVSTFDHKKAMLDIFKAEAAEKKEILKIFWDEALKGNTEVQESLYKILKNRMGKIESVDSDKAPELLQAGIKQNKVWAFRTNAQALEAEGKTEEATNFYIKAAHQDDSISIEKLNVLLKCKAFLEPYKKLNQSLSAINRQIQKDCKRFKDLKYGTPLVGIYKFLKEVRPDVGRSLDSLLEGALNIRHPFAQFIMACHYYVRGDITNTMDHLLLAAEQGHPEAQYNAGILLSSGVKSQKADPKHAPGLFLQAAKQGLPKAQCTVGTILLFTKGQEAEGFDWLQQAAAQKSLSATVALSIYCLRVNKPQDALFWAEKAHALGGRRAQKYFDLINKATASNEPESDKLESEIGAFVEEIFQPQTTLQTFKSGDDKPVATSSSSSSSSSSISQAVESPKEEDDSPALFPEMEKEEEAPKTPKKSALIQNPKYIREQMKKLGELRKQRQEETQKPRPSISDKNKPFIEHIKALNRSVFTLNNLINFFEDPFFRGDVQVSPTKSGVIIGAFVREKNQHMTTATHRVHQKKQSYHDSPTGFIRQVREILRGFGLIKD